MLLCRIYFVLYFSTLQYSIALENWQNNNIFGRTKQAVLACLSAHYLRYLTISELKLAVLRPSEDPIHSAIILSYCAYKY